MISLHRLNLVLLASLLTVACDSSDEKSNNTEPKLSAITDEFIQTNASISQRYSASTLNISANSMYEQGASDYFGDTDVGLYCGSGACYFDQAMGSGDVHKGFERLQTLDIQSGKTFRYRTASEINGESLSSPIDENGESRLVTLFLNDNGLLTPARRKMVLNAIDTLQSQVGVKLFNDDIHDIYMSQFDVEDYLVQYGSVDPVWQNRNLWHGDIYNENHTLKYDADSETHSDPNSALYGTLIESDSYKEIIGKYGVRGAITISFGTTVSFADPEPCSMYKANFSTFPFDGGNTGYFLDEKAYITNANWHMVNLGQHSQYCNNLDTIDEELIIHELAHAIGLQGHFEGFGEGAVWSEQAAAVLRAIYNHPVATPYDQLSVVE